MTQPGVMQHHVACVADLTSLKIANETSATLALYLQVVLRVPVGIKDDAGVCGRQVDAETAGSRAQQEDESVRVWSGEAVDGSLPKVATNSAVYTFIGISGHRGGGGRR